MDLRPPLVAALSAAVLVLLLSALPATAHVERPSYFPDPSADRSVSPAAGGGVPKIRSLSSALDRKRPGETRVVCQRDSMRLLTRSVREARANGYQIRPSDRRRLTKRQARGLLVINRRLKKLCKYNEIQPAVNDSGNNDRVVVMPGLYLEPTARSQPTNDERCTRYRTDGDRPGEPGTALSYAYQFNCPNDQNLVAVLGRAVSPQPDVVPPRQNRHGIPNPGECIRCNFQIEGSGVAPGDVVVDAGDHTKGNGGPNGVGAKKDVVIRADRADGFVLRNMTTRHAGEHGIYVHEVDGYMLDRFGSFFNKLYGTLTFSSDHGVHQNCDTAGHGDSGIYPGGAPETGVQRLPGTEARLNQEVRRCDMHHNLAGYSGTNGNAVHIHDNNIYDNALGIQTDIVTAAGHPGFPGDSMLVEDNRIYSNNFNTYAPDSDVKPAFPFPTGTGMWIAGGNHHRIRDNFFYDNHRRGTMVFTVPDALICGPGAGGNEQAGCDSKTVSTSHYNMTFDNRMGVRPDGKQDANGVDFWWDNFGGSRGNCWFRNSGPKPITTDPQGRLPSCNDGRDPAQSVGTGDDNEGELLSCVAAFETRNFDQNGPCPWVRSPADPGDDGSGGGGGAMARHASFTRPAIAPARRTPRAEVPLGQLNCTDWQEASEAEQDAMAAKLGGFAGGVVNVGVADIGHGATLTAEQAQRLYDGACAPAYASEFLLYKLYTFAGAFSGR
jgi:hypothetical protein